MPESLSVPESSPVPESSSDEGDQITISERPGSGLFSFFAGVAVSDLPHISVISSS